MSKITQSKSKSKKMDKIFPIYFKALKIKDIKCFKGENTINFSDGEKPFQWNIILGNNNTGKTTLLKCIADLTPHMPYKGQVHPANELCVPINIKKHARSQRSIEGAVYCSLFIGKNSHPQNIQDNVYKTFLNNPILPGNVRPKKRRKKDDPIAEFGWGFSNASWNIAQTSDIYNLRIFGYGTSRRVGKTTLSEMDTESEDFASSIFSDEITLVNSEEWLLQTDYAVKNGLEMAVDRLEKIKHLLTSGILPDVKDFKFETDNFYKSFVSVRTDYGWSKLNDLGYGYQTTIAWIIDLAKKMFDKYPNSENPLSEYAIILIDEIDLHLHPAWQRNIVSFLTKFFPNAQFIVTSHSPLVVQSGDNVNLIILNKEGDHVRVDQPKFKNFKGWTVDEILFDLMGMGEKVQSDTYLELIKSFDDSLDANDYESAEKSYNQLCEILHPESPQRKLLKIQLASIKKLETHHNCNLG